MPEYRVDTRTIKLVMYHIDWYKSVSGNSDGQNIRNDFQSSYTTYGDRVIGPYFRIKVVQLLTLAQTRVSKTKCDGMLHAF